MNRDQFIEFFRSEDFHSKVTDDDCIEIFSTVLKGRSDFTKELLDEIFKDYEVYDIKVEKVDPAKDSIDFVLKYLPKHLLDITEFNEKHRIELLMGADWQMQCIIDGKCYGTGLNTLEALLVGYLQYIKHNKK